MNSPANQIPSLKVGSETEKLNSGRSWVAYLNEVASASPLGLDPRFLLGLEEKSQFTDFQNKSQAIRESIESLRTLALGGSKTEIVSQSESALGVLDALGARYNSKDDWDALLKESQAPAAAREMLKRLKVYGYSTERFSFDRTRDNPLAALGYKIAPDDFQRIASNPTSKEFVDLIDNLDLIIEARKRDYTRIKGQSSDPALGNIIDQLFQRDQDALAYIKRFPGQTAARLATKAQSAKEYVASFDEEVNVQSGYWAALTLLGLSLKQGGQPLNLAHVEKAYLEKLQFLEDAQEMGIDKSKLKVISSKLTEAYEKLNSHNQIRIYLADQKKRADSVFFNLDYRMSLLDLDRSTHEYGELRALGFLRDPASVSPKALEDNYIADSNFLNNPVTRQHLGEHLCSELSRRLDEAFVKVVHGLDSRTHDTPEKIRKGIEEQKAKDKRYKALRKCEEYQKVENVRRYKRVKEEAEKRSKQQNAKYSEFFGSLKFLSNPKRIAQVSKYLIYAGVAGSVAIAGASFGGALLPLFAPLGPLGGLIGGGAAIALPPYLLSLQGPKWLAETAMTRFFELQQRYLGNKFIDLFQKVKEPEEFFPVFEDIAITLLMYQRKIPESRKRLILEQYYRAKPVFEQVVKDEESDPFTAKRDIEMLKLKAVILGIETGKTKENGQLALTKGELAQIAESEADVLFPDGKSPGTFAQRIQGWGGGDEFRYLLDETHAEMNHNEYHKYYNPKILDEFYPNRKGYSINEDLWTFFSTALKLHKTASTLHGKQSPEEKAQVLGQMKGESKEVAEVYNGFAGGEGTKVESLLMKLLMQQDDLPTGLFAQSQSLKFIQELDQKARESSGT